MSGHFVLSRKAGEEGAPTQLGEVRGSGIRLRAQEDFPSSPHCVPQRVPSFPAEEAGEDMKEVRQACMSG